MSNTPSLVPGSLQALDAAKPRITVYNIATSEWPSTLILDLTANNWTDWNQRLTWTLVYGSMYRYTAGTEPLPDPADEPRATCNWQDNDYAVRQLISSHISKVENNLITKFKFTTSKAIYDFLASWHQKQGIFPQILLLQEALSIRTDADTPFPDNVVLLDDYASHIWGMGAISEDHLRCVFYLNMLSCPAFTALRDQIHLQFAQTPNLQPSDIAKCLQSAQTMHTLDKGPVVVAPVAPVSTYVTSLSPLSSSPRLALCSNCKKSKHLPTFCIAPGGGMAGKTIDDARTVQHASHGLPASGKSNHSPGSSSPAPVAFNASGLAVPVQSSSGQPAYLQDGVIYHLATPTPPPAHGSDFGLLADKLPMTLGDSFEHAVWTASAPLPLASDVVLPTSLVVSVDWSLHSRVLASANLCSGTLVEVSPLAKALSLTDSPFFLVTGATTHLSPERSDFIDLRPIPHRPITSVGSTSISAIGIGTIRLSVGHNACLVLNLSKSRF